MYTPRLKEGEGGGGGKGDRIDGKGEREQEGSKIKPHRISEKMRF